jgi:hypothetical protein
MTSSVTGNFPDSLRDWKYQPKFCSERQLPQLASLPPEAATLQDIPWFELPSQSTGFDINARHVRYRHSLWQELKPKVLQGVHTTLVLALPQIGFALAPHIQLEKVFLFLGSLARGLGTVQLFPARYLYPDAHLGGLANMPAPIFADLPAHQGGLPTPAWTANPTPGACWPTSATGIAITDIPSERQATLCRTSLCTTRRIATACFFRLPMRLIPALVRNPPYSQAHFRAERSQSFVCGALPSVAPQESRNFVTGGHSIQTNARRVTTVGFTSTNRK